MLAAYLWRSSVSDSISFPRSASSELFTESHPDTGVSITVKVPAFAAIAPVSSASQSTSTVPPPPITTGAVVRNLAPVI